MPISNTAAASAPSQGSILAPARDAVRLCEVSIASWWCWQNFGHMLAPIRLSAGCVRLRAEEFSEWKAIGCPDRRTWEKLWATEAAQRNGRG